MNNFIKIITKKYNVYTGKFKTVHMCNLYHMHRFWDFKNWVFNHSDVADDAWIKSQSEDMYQQIFSRICFNTEYLYRAVSDIYWFEQRGIKSHLCYDVIKNLINHYSQGITMEYFDEFYATLWGEWNWSQAKKNRFRSSCNSFRTRLYNELNVHFDDDHPTMKHFSGARWFNIDTAADFPESARNALTNVP